MRTGIYGGTFNPVHLGHVKMLNDVIKGAGLDKTIVLPDRIPPHKLADLLVSGEDRLNMCRIAFKSCPNTKVSSWELRQEGKSYSVYTLRHFHALYPHDELWFIMGSDMLLSFTQWYNYEEILTLAGLVCTSRCEEDTPLLEGCADKLRALGGKVNIITAPPLEVSSSQVRERLMSGQGCEGLMDSGVLKYIKEHSLYTQKNT